LAENRAEDRGRSEDAQGHRGGRSASKTASSPNPLEENGDRPHFRSEDTEDAVFATSTTATWRRDPKRKTSHDEGRHPHA
jgi:hypothetical protein